MALLAASFERILSLKLCAGGLLALKRIRLRHSVTNEAAEALHESVAWGSDVELEAMESEQVGFSLSRPSAPVLCGSP